ncbi:adenomatous polyposis coli protein 2 [Paramormyrops kingsleyae]|uniref:adenomatous polyposis coli protein 2 n=1 Tax=Paramormyrops kingsleyae TaxID=1676925 RepID=UPI003B972395
MSNSVASYDQLVLQVEALRKENTHLRRELEDNSNHLSKLENETSDMKEVLKQLQNKLEQEACTLTSSGRTDVLEQLKELHMDLTNYYELKYQPHNLRVLPDSLAPPAPQVDDKLPHHPSGMLRASSPPYIATRQGPVISGEGTAPHPGPPHLLEPRVGLPGDGRVTTQHLEDLCKERDMLLNEIEKEERERRWYYSQLQGLSQRLAELPRIDTFSMQMDLIRQQLEFEAQQLRSVMEERFGTCDEMVQRTQIRVARLEQLERELQEVKEAQGSQEKSLPVENQATAGEKTAVPGESENISNTSGLDVPGETGSKVEMVFWLLSMLATRDREEMSRTLLAMSSSQDSCMAMRKSGCVPLLVQILHDGLGGTGEVPGSGGCSREARSRASAALHNIVYSQPDEGQARREMRVLHVLEQIRSHCESGWDWIETHVTTPSPGGTKNGEIPEAVEPQICQAMCAIMKLSFEEEYRRAMNELGGLQAVAELLQLDQELYGTQNDPLNLALRRYAGMALTNLTFGDVVNKATLCTKKSCLQAIVAQLASDSEELHQVVASILRNLSWRADINSKRALRDVGSVSALIQCALQATKESTLKSVLSALWNLSAHSSENKVAICSVSGALGFLVSTLTYRCQTNSLAIIESGGGILRNISSLVATREDYRQILRDHNCLQTLLQHLRSHSLTIVSNACGTLWNLSARSPKDQELLWDLGAVSMLRNLIHSKHKMIAMGSAAALRNLLTNRPLKYKDAAVVSPGSCMPSLYMRKQKALEAELDAKHLAETFDSIEKQTAKHACINKPLRHIESLAKDYASDSGCFDDDEAPNVSSSLDTGNYSMLPMFLNNTNFLQGQTRKKDCDPQHDMVPETDNNKRVLSHENEGSAAAETLARKITSTVAKIDKLVDDITMHTSSEDSFSLSSEDHFVDWQYGSDEVNEARAKSCSPCRLSDTSSFTHRERLSRAHALIRLKTAYTSLSTDSLNSGSTSDSCGGKDQIRPSVRSAMVQRRPNKLELKTAHQGYLNNKSHLVNNEESHKEVPERDTGNSRENRVQELSSTDTEKDQEPPPPTPATTKLTSAPNVSTIKLSPSYQHVPLIQSVAKFGVAKSGISVQAAQAMRRQAWVPAAMTGGSITKFSPMNTPRSPTVGQMETLQRYSVENTPICFSRCSSLSSLSSGDGALDGQSQSENELDSDSSLEIIEVEDSNLERGEDEDELLEDLSDSQLLITDPKTFGSSSSPTSEPIDIPSSTKQDKLFPRGVSPGMHEDRTPSTSSENYIHETPLVMSRCSSVSSLGSFESPSIASSIQSDPCSEMISGTISPSDLPDSPGQTMPPSRSKTPCCTDSNLQETQIGGGGGQWESNMCKLVEIADFKERFNLPPDLDTMIYFTVEKPTENFSCASSLSALPLHEHYIQKDVELKLMPLLHQKDNNPTFTVTHAERDELGEKHSSFVDQTERYSEGNSDDDIEILKECINSAMPSKFKVRTSLMSTLSTQVLNSQARKSVQFPVYMVLPNHNNQKCTPAKMGMPQKDVYHDDSSFTDSAEGTPVNFSSTTSLSDETLQYPVKDKSSKDWRPRTMDKQEVIDLEAKRIEELRAFSRFQKPTKITQSQGVPGNQMNRAFKQGIPTQKMQMNNREMDAKMSQQRSRDSSPQYLSYKQEQNKSWNMAHLESTKMKQNIGGGQNQNMLYKDLTHGMAARQSMSHPTPAGEAIYSFCDNLNTKQKDKNSIGRKQMKECNRNLTHGGSVADRMKHKGVRIKHNLIADETPPCYSLSSSLSSLSDVDLEEYNGKMQQVWVKSRHHITSNLACDTSKNNCSQYEENGSTSSGSLNSEDDLLQKCITSAMPKQRRKQSARKKKSERKQKLKSRDGWASEKDLDSDERASDKDSDLNSVEWRAIQEGANSVVTRLQAASKSQEPLSESESVLSFMSGVSTGSSLQTKAGKNEKRKTTKDHDNKGRKISEGRNTRTQLDFAVRKPVPNLPVVFRGRTVIYMPKKETTLSQRPPTKKTSSKAETQVKNPNLAQQRSRSLHRLGRPNDSNELLLPRRSSTPPARIPKSTSSGSSQSSTPSRQPQKKLVSPTQTNKPALKKDVKPANMQPDIRGNSNTPTSQKPINTKLPVQKKTQKSPVRIPFMQNPSRQPMASRTISPLVTNQSSAFNRQNSQVPVKRTLPASRLELVRMTSIHSNSGESDRNGFLRQLTFIKESSNVLRHEVPSSRSVPTSQCASPRRARPGAPAVFLCSSRCQELKPSSLNQRQMQGRPDRSTQGEGQTINLSRASSSERDLSVKRPARRTSSESPCRVPQRTTSGTWNRNQESFKRHSSSPSINILNRVTSQSSVRSSSSDSSGRAKSEHNVNHQQPGTRANGRVTWRRIRDEDVPHILRSTLPSSALPLIPSPDGHKKTASIVPGKLPTISSPSRKTSDAIVQTEDFPTKKTSTSSTPEKVPVIPEEAEKLVPIKKLSKASEANIHLQDEGSDGTAARIMKSQCTTSTSLSTAGHSGGVAPFRHSSPSKAARVTPFNYVPSPMTSSLQDTPGQAPVLNEKPGDKLEAQ